MDSLTDPQFFTAGVSPFGNPRINTYFQFPVAYRRLSRPSSALGAKAFTLCSFSLEQPHLLILSNLQVRFLLELSQIIVWVVNSKDLSNLHCFFRRCVTTPCSKIVYPLFSGKTLIILNVFLNTTICFVSLFGFQ